MSPPPTIRPPIQNGPPSRGAKYAWILAAVVGLAAIWGAVAMMSKVRDVVENENPEVPVSPLLPKRKNLSSIVKHNPDGWFDIAIDDFPMHLKLPGRPSRTPGSRSFMPDESWTKDYNAYQVIAQGIAVAITGYWLNEAGTNWFSDQGNYRNHVDAAAGGSPKAFTPKIGLPRVEGRTYSFQNGPVTNHVALIAFMQRKDLVVKISVSARTPEEAKSKLDKVLSGLKINEQAKK